MNLFLIHPDPLTSAHILAAADPVRARKQLLEACQLLANFGTLLRSDGEPYGKTHPHHPITRHMAISDEQFDLACAIAMTLADVYPTHACAESFQAYQCERVSTGGRGYVVCRKGRPVVYTRSLEHYAGMMAEYCREAKGMTLTKTAT